MPSPTANPLVPRCLAIVPVFNEGGSVGKVIRRLLRALPEFDVLVIDDGSTDDTLRRIPSGVAVVGLPFNLGIGGAMQAGYRYAALHGYDIAVQVDGDGQHRPSEVRRLVEYLLEGQADLVVGSRFLGPSKYHQTLIRRTGARLLRTLIRLLTGQTITDCTSGFRAANRRVIRAFAHWYPEDFPEPEVILLLHRAGYRIGELHVRMRQRQAGASSIGMLAGVFYVMKVVTCLMLDTARAPWPHEKVGGHGRGGGANLHVDLMSDASDPSLAGDGASHERPASNLPGRDIRNSHDQESDPARPWRQPVPAGRVASPPL